MADFCGFGSPLKKIRLLMKDLGLRLRRTANLWAWSSP
jgi:hypothetical protein